MADLSYPIGTFSLPESTTREQRQEWIRDIAAAPERMRAAVAGLTGQQLDTPYRPGGWTVRQVVHHVPESHMNAYVRMKLALTEHTPVIKPYDEKLWAGTPDVATAPLEPSLLLLDGLHQRWARLFEALSDSDFTRAFNHPEIGHVRLDQLLGSYAWHGKHHTAHITSLRQRMNW